MEDGKMFIERRVHPRFLINIPVKFCRVDDQNEIDTIREFSKKDMFALVRDISLGGMQIEVKQPLNVWDVLAFEITLPGNAQPLIASAEVVWVDGNRAGLHFLIISEEDTTALKAYLKLHGFRS